MAETPLSDSAVYFARPTVRVGGEDRTRVSELLIAMEMNESEGGLSSLELRLSNVASLNTGGAALAFEDEQALTLGSELSVYCGDASGPREIFRGIVTGLESEFSQDSPPEIVILAEDKLQLARMQRRTQIHEDTTIRALAESLASTLGLTPVITGFTENIGTRMQLNESDLAFVRRTLRAYDGDLQVVGDELHVSPRADVDRGELELQLYGQLTRLRMRADLAMQTTEVTVGGWDAVNGSRFVASSSGAQLPPGEGRPGAQVLEDSIGTRSEHIGHVPVLNETEAQACADAAFDQRARRFVCADGTTEGNPSLRVGTRLRLTGVSPRFENTYYVVRACHRFDVTRGYETDFEAECAYLGGP